MTYDYNKPRRLNVVSFLMLCVVVAGGYLGYKFIPVYWQARKIDEELDMIKMRGATMYRMNDDNKSNTADSIINASIAKLHELGLEDTPDQPIQVWFSPDYTELHARYQVIVKHPGGKQTIMTMDRLREMPQR
jgi:hypothetical protein